MKKDTIEISYELSDLIRQSDAYLTLQKLEQEIALDNNLLALEQAFIDAQEHLIMIDEHGSETEKSEARKALSKAKYDLDIHPLVISYNATLKQLNQIYDKVNERVFFKFRNHKSCKI